MISPISSITSAATYASHARSNANFLTQYTAFADRYYAPPSDPAAVAPGGADQNARPLTRALPNLKSVGAFGYLRGAGKSGNSAGAKSHSAAFRAPAPSAAEVPVMPPMARSGDQLDAIHDDAAHDNPMQVDGVHRTRLPGSDGRSPEKKRMQLAPMPAASGGDGGVTRAIRERNRAMLTIFSGANELYRTFSGRYAA